MTVRASPEDFPNTAVKEQRWVDASRVWHKSHFNVWGKASEVQEWQLKCLQMSIPSMSGSRGQRCAPWQVRTCALWRKQLLHSCSPISPWQNASWWSNLPIFKVKQGKKEHWYFNVKIISWFLKVDNLKPKVSKQQIHPDWHLAGHSGADLANRTAVCNSPLTPNVFLCWHSQCFDETLTS